VESTSAATGKSHRSFFFNPAKMKASAPNRITDEQKRDYWFSFVSFDSARLDYRACWCSPLLERHWQEARPT
jgi:hypothetical protein